MNTRYLAFPTAAIACVLPLALSSARAESSLEINVPLKRSLIVPATGEAVDLDAVISVFTSTSAGANSTNIDYSCEISGRGTTNSQTPYAATGLSAGSLHSELPLPSDVGFGCDLMLSALDATQSYQLRIQASLGADGALTSVVVLDVAPLP